VGQIVQLYDSSLGRSIGPLGVVVRHDAGRVPFFLTQDGPVVGTGARVNRDVSVVDLIAGLDQLVLPVPVKVHVVATQRRLVKCRAAVWTANLCKTANLTEITAQEDAEVDKPEAAIYLAWNLFTMRFTRFVKKHHLNAVASPRVEVGRKPLSAGRLLWNNQGYRRAGTWFDAANERLLNRSFEDIMAAGKAIVESKASGREAS
jgi:hypothetical protein